MSFDAIKGKPEKELVAKLNELSDEQFKAKFTTEAMTPARGAQMLKRRREMARIRTVLQGRKALDGARTEEKRLEAAIKGLGAPHKGTPEQKNARRKLVSKLEQVKRTIRELNALEGK
ncbi:MAG: 50S ribosomal protein L29 [Planctomycetes bacterium]|nr:50S ribosomal protein L29 [Planctomycetota bacterium]MCW8136482.1 50S ribosomal protein L29 [Planctomycetota bacterium]